MPIKPMNMFPFRIPQSIDGDKVFEGQSIHLDHPLQADGRIVLKNCSITVDHGKLLLGGELLVENCEIISKGGTILSATSDASVHIKDTTFKYPLMPYGMISAVDTKQFLLENCSFARDESQMLPALPLLVAAPVDRWPTIDAGGGRIVGCSFQDVFPEINAMEIMDSMFVRCNSIQCGFADKDNLMERCTFTDCRSVSVEDGKLRNCTLTRVESLYLTRAMAENCSFKEVRCDDTCFICLEDGTVSNCTFDRAELKNDARFCDAVGDSIVTHCRFVNCHADEPWEELFRGKETTGKLRKQTLEYSVLDEDTCSGVADI